MSDRLDLGVGIVALGGLDLLWPAIADLVDVVEVEPQTLWDEVPGGWVPNEEANAWLRGLDRPLLAHGVGFPVGGQVEPDPRGVALFAECCTDLDAIHTSEHLSFNRVVSSDVFLHAGFLLPPRQTWETVDAAVVHITNYQRQVGKPFLIECGVSYVRPGPGELDDGTFLSEIVERADCGLLLDLHNLLANERNQRAPVEEVLRNLPLDRVQEVHLAGGFELDGYWLDAHSGPCEQTLLYLLETTLPLLANVRAVIFEALPPFLMSMGPAVVRRQLDLIHEIVDRASRHPVRSQPRPGRARIGVGSPEMSEAEWQRRVVAYTTRRSDTPPTDDPGFVILRELTDQARLGRVAAGAGQTVTELRRRVGDRAVQNLASEYLTACDAEVWTSAEATAFERWIGGRGIGAAATRLSARHDTLAQRTIGRQDWSTMSSDPSEPGPSRLARHRSRPQAVR